MNRGVSHGLLVMASMISILESDGIYTDEETVRGILEMGGRVVPSFGTTCDR